MCDCVNILREKTHSVPVWNWEITLYLRKRHKMEKPPNKDKVREEEKKNWNPAKSTPNPISFLDSAILNCQQIFFFTYNFSDWTIRSLWIRNNVIWGKSLCTEIQKQNTSAFRTEKINIHQSRERRRDREKRSIPPAIFMGPLLTWITTFHSIRKKGSTHRGIPKISNYTWRTKSRFGGMKVEYDLVIDRSI